MDTSNRMNKRFKMFVLIFALLTLIIFLNRNAISQVLNSVAGKGLEVSLKKQYKGSNIRHIDGSIVMLKDYSISFLDQDGQVIVTKDLGSSNIDIVLGEENIYSIDKLTGDIYVFSSQGESLNRFQTGLDVFSIREMKDGLLAHSKGGNMERISLIDKDGDLRKLYEVEDKNILTYSLNKKGQLLVSHIGQSGQNIISKIEVLDQGQIQYEDEYNNEIVIFSDFVEDRLLVLTDSRISIIKSEEEVFNKAISNIEDIYIDGDLIYLLYDSDLAIMDLEGNIISKSTYKDYKDIIPVEDYIVLFGLNKYAILQNQVKIVEYNTDEQIQYISGNNDILAITMDNKMEIYDLIIK